MSKEHLIPAPKGNNGFGGGRPKGSRNAKTILRQYLRMNRIEFDKLDKKSQLMIELVVENMVRRAANKGGQDLKEVLSLTGGLDDPENPIKGSQYTDSEARAIYEIELKRLRRQNGKAE